MAWRRVSLVCLSIGSAMMLAGCGGSSDAVAPPTSTTTVAAPVTTTTTTVPPTTTTTTTTTIAPPPTTTEAPTTTLVDVPYEHNESYFFTSPDGGFQCGIIKLPNRTEAGCQGSTSPVPPRPADCMVDWGHGIRVEKNGEASFMCAGGPRLHVGRRRTGRGPARRGEAVQARLHVQHHGHGRHVHQRRDVARLHRRSRFEQDVLTW